MLQLSFRLVINRPSITTAVIKTLQYFTGCFHAVSFKAVNTLTYNHFLFCFFQWNIMVKLRGEYESNRPSDPNIKQF